MAPANPEGAGASRREALHVADRSGTSIHIDVIDDEARIRLRQFDIMTAATRPICLDSLIQAAQWARQAAAGSIEVEAEPTPIACLGVAMSLVRSTDPTEPDHLFLRFQIAPSGGCEHPGCWPGVTLDLRRCDALAILADWFTAWAGALFAPDISTITGTGTGTGTEGGRQ